MNYRFLDVDDIDDDVFEETQGQHSNSFTGGRLYRFIWNYINFNRISENELKDELTKLGLKVKFINIKFNIGCSQTQSKKYENDSYIPALDKMQLHYDYKCFVEVVNSPTVQFKLQELQITEVLDCNLFPTAKSREWHPNIMKTILSFFHSPPAVSKEHIDNSYNALAQYVMENQRCHFSAFKDHLYFTKFIVKACPDNIFALDVKWRNNKEVMKEAIKRKNGMYERAGKRVRHDKEIARLALNQNYEVFRCIPKRFKDKEMYFIYWIQRQFANPQEPSLNLVSKKLKSSDELALELVKINPENLKYASKKAQANFIIVLEAVARNGSLIRFADKTLQNDVNIVKVALNNTDHTLQVFDSLPDEMKNTKSVVLCAVKNYPLLFKSLTTFKDDLDVIKIAVEQNSSMYAYVSEEMKGNEELAYFILSRHCQLFESFPLSLRSDEAIVTVATKTNASQLIFASEEMRNNKTVAMIALENNSEIFECLSPQLRDDFEVASKALLRNVNLIYCLGENLQKNKQFGLFLLDAHPQAFELLLESLRSDKDIVMKAVCYNGLYLQYASEKMRNDSDVVVAAIRNNLYAKEYMGPAAATDRSVLLCLLECDSEAVMPIPEYLCNDEEFLEKHRSSALRLVSKKGHMLKQVDQRYAKDKEFMKASVRANYTNLKNVSKSLLEDFEFMLEIIQANGYAIQFAPSSLICTELIEIAKESILKQMDTFTSVDVLFTLPDYLTTDKDFILKVLKKDGSQYEYIDMNLKEDKEIVLTALQSNADMLILIPKFFKEDKDFLQEAVTYNPKLFENSCVAKFAEDIAFIEYAVSKNGFCIQYAPPWLQKDASMIRLAEQSIIAKVTKHTLTNCFENLPIAMQKHKKFVLQVVSKNGLQLQYVHNDLKEDYNVVLEAVLSNNEALEFAPEHLRQQFKLMLHESYSVENLYSCVK